LGRFAGKIGGSYLFFLLAWGVNYYNIYQSNDFNGVCFTVRGRALKTPISGAHQSTFAQSYITVASTIATRPFLAFIQL